MFYIINKKYEIVQVINSIELIPGVMQKYINNLVNSDKAIHKTVNYMQSFSDVVKEGVYFTERDNIFIVRDYELSRGFLYNALTYHEIDRLYACEYIKPISGIQKPPVTPRSN